MLLRSSGGRTFGGMGGGGGGPPSWICDVTSGRHLGFVVTWFPVTWFPVTWLFITWLPHRKSRDRKSRDHKSKMATGSDVTTNPRWRPEVTSQIQDGGPPPPPPIPPNVRPRSWQKCPLNVWKRSDQEVRTILFCLQFLSMDFFYIWHR